MQEKYKIGDIVRVRSNLKGNTRYYYDGSDNEYLFFNIAMQKFCGHAYKIIDKVSSFYVYLAERTLSATISCVLHATGKTTLMNFLKLRNQVELQFLHPKRKQLARLKILSRIQTAQR